MAKTKKIKTSSARQKIIDTALRLFNKQGVHHTGIDQIISESEVAKMTFYNHFATKAKLVAEYLRQRDERWFSQVELHMSRSQDPVGKILAIFDALYSWFSEPDFYGCPFIRGLSDFDENDDPEIAECVHRHFNQTGVLIEEQLQRAQIKNSKQLAAQILGLIAGAIVVSHATKSPQAALLNKETAKLLLQTPNFSSQ